jgi:hypothetical protein
MSVREIMERHTRGLPLGGEKIAFYDEENDLPDPRTLDLVDRQNLMENYKDEISDLKEKHSKKPPKPKPKPLEQLPLDLDEKQKSDEKKSDEKTNTP